MRTLGGALLAALVLAGAARAQSLQKIAESLPSYQRTAGVTGRIKSVGSDTMNNEMILWTEGFLTFYPAVKVEVEGKGSTTAPVALVDGTANFGPMSRVMKDAEIDAFKKKYGYEPTPLRTSIDMLAVYVNKDNPLAKKGLNFAQLDAIFSSTRKQGHKAVNTWGDLGLTGEWADEPISIYGRNAASGTYGFFKQNVLLNGDFKAGVKEQPGSSAVVQAVARDKYAIGYSGIGYNTADVEALPLARDKDDDPATAEVENAYSGDYPLARPLYVYVNYDPTRNLDPLRAEFFKYIFSRQGQFDVIKSGYLPVGRAIAQQDLKSVGLSLGK